MPTARGTKLLVSGWWGMARKINYTGDWCMGLSWCLLAGSGSLVRAGTPPSGALAPLASLLASHFCGTVSLPLQVPYFYAIYFGILLVHRAIRDDGMCAAKYGADWAEYKKRVPSTFIPGIPI